MEIDPVHQTFQFNSTEQQLIPPLKEQDQWPTTAADDLFAHAESCRKQLRLDLVGKIGLKPEEYQVGLNDYNTICRIQSLLSPYLHGEAGLS